MIRLALVTLFDRRMARVGAQTSARLCAYGRRQGLPVFCFRSRLDPRRPAAWSKLPAIERALDRSRCDWALWVDADALVMNLSFDARSLVDPRAEVSFGRDENGLCSALILVRNSPWARQLLRTASFLGDADAWFRTAPMWEQNAFRALIDAFPDVAARTRLLPGTGLIPGPANYRPGDFLIHMGGMSDRARRSWLQAIGLMERVLEAASAASRPNAADRNGLPWRS